MKSKLENIANITIKDNKATMNNKALELLKNEDIKTILKNIDLSKNMDFLNIGDNFYLVNIIKNGETLLLFTKIDNIKSLLKITRQDRNNLDIDIYSKEITREFLEKFLALKRRYGGFTLKLLYFKVNFTMAYPRSVENETLDNILKYIVGITRSSDVVGHISDNSFALILTNPLSEGVSIISDKIYDYIARINLKNGKRIIEVYGAVLSEISILKMVDFDKLIEVADKSSKFVVKGGVLPEIY